jgi:predicted nucleotidyltransferase component of viral defense system
MLNNDETRHYIRVLSDKLSLEEFVIEKDLYVTKAIAVVTQVQHPYFELIFQGGTALAKAHRIIERMSEDCDFRIRYKVPEKPLSKAQKRKALREFRHEIIAVLRANDFKFEDETIRVRNLGQFMSIRANYPSIFPHVETMKPYLALEFFLNDVRVEPVIKPVTTLVKQVLGDSVDHAEFNVNSVAIIETAAEKWVALTRRVANCRDRLHYRDASLVRHLYDLYKINQAGHFSDTFNALVPGIVMSDKIQFQAHSEAYFKDPASEIRRATDVLANAPVWRENWLAFVDTMVFEELKPTFEEVIDNLGRVSEVVLLGL